VELDELSHAFGSLRAHQQQALLLVCGNGLSYMQAARACNCAVGTIRSRIARARDHLTRLLHMDELPLQSTLASAGLGTTNAQALP
jgi:RNA polymerase sigma-70 factor (ECF subfamily)